MCTPRIARRVLVHLSAFALFAAAACGGGTAERDGVRTVEIRGSETLITTESELVGGLADVALDVAGRRTCWITSRTASSGWRSGRSR